MLSAKEQYAKDRTMASKFSIEEQAQIARYYDMQNKIQDVTDVLSERKNQFHEHFKNNSEDAILTIACHIVYDGDMDSNMTYWDNINRLIDEICEPYKHTDIASLPDGTFFYVKNGNWQGFITTEDGKKVCYAGATKENPTKEYVHRFVINDTYDLDIEILYLDELIH